MLRKTLEFTIKSRGEVDLQELHAISRSMNHRDSNCERCLRKICENGGIEPIKNEKGYVIAYKTI